MEHDDLLAQQSFIFGILFVLANKLQIIGDRLLGEFTTKQWFLTAVIARFGDTPPTLSEVSQVMGSSHQNVKQIALKLQEKGFLSIEKDQRDSRVLRLKLTEKSNTYWKQRQTEDERNIITFFDTLTTDEIKIMVQGLTKLHQRVEELL